MSLAYNNAIKRKPRSSPNTHTCAHDVDMNISIVLYYMAHTARILAHTHARETQIAVAMRERTV